MVVLALLGGSLLATRQYRPPFSESETAEARPSAVDRQEQILLEGLEQDTEPERFRDQRRIVRGVTNRIELAQLYLDQRRLEEADQLFAKLTASKIPQYMLLGRLGHGMVLAYQNRPTESNKAILDNLAELKRTLLLYNNMALKYELARALAFNKANATADSPFPTELERLVLPERPYKVKWP
jgi:hypothetical protein